MSYLQEYRPTICIIGSNSQLGSEFINYLNNYKNLISYDKEHLDITNREHIKSLPLRKGDILINCAAYNSVYGPEAADKESKEIEKSKCFKVNALGPKYLSKFCRKRKIKLVHYSTNYVFNDSRCTMKNYTEFDSVKPFLFYGFSKLCGEKLIKELLPDNSIIIRTAWMFSKDNLFIKNIKKFSDEKKEMHIANALGTPTYTLDLVKQTLHLVDNKVTGLYHCVNTGKASKKEYVDKITKLLNLELKTTTKHPGPSMLLDNFMLNIEGLNKMRPWEEAIEECFRN